MWKELSVEKPATSVGKVSCWEHSTEFGILMPGASVSRVLLVLKHMGLAVFSLRTYFLHQRTFLFPVVLHYWEEYWVKLLDQLKGIPGAVWSGDGRFDSMGHNAKYGTYTMLSCDLMKIVHFDILQVSNIIICMLQLNPATAYKIYSHLIISVYVKLLELFLHIQY